MKKERQKENQQPDTLELADPFFAIGLIGSRERMQRLHTNWKSEGFWFLSLIVLFVSIFTTLGFFWHLDNNSLLLRYLPSIKEPILYVVVFTIGILGSVGAFILLTWMVYFVLMISGKYVLSPAKMLFIISLVSLNVVGLMASTFILLVYPRILQTVHPTERTVWRDWKGRVQNAKDS